MRLIDADALKKTLEKLWNVHDDDDFANKDVWREIENSPTIEPERKKGKWVHKPNEYDDDTYECSRCGEPWTLIEGTPKENNMNYCPNCGAEMKK